MTITAKFASTCRKCHAGIKPGQTIDWSRGSASAHVNPADCAAAIAEREAAKATQPPAPVLNLQSVHTFLDSAKQRGLKRPKARFLAPDGTSEMRLSLAPLTGKNPGAVYVVIAEEYVGAVMPDGEVRGKLAQRADVRELLTTIAADPASAAKAYGRLSGRCSFCDAVLTDDRTGSSVEYGYGPVCAKRYGLPHAPKGKAKVLQPVLDVALATLAVA